MILVANAQLVWHVSIMQSLSCKSWTVPVGDSLKWSWRWSSAGRPPLHVWCQLGITGTDSQNVTCYQPQGLLPGRLKGCQVLHTCYLLLPACKEIKLTPFKKFSSSKRGLLAGTSWNCGPCTHESNSLDVYTAKHARSLRKVQEDRLRSLCVVCALLATFRNRQWLFWDLPISVWKSTNIALQVLIMQCLLIEERRRWNAG